MESYEFSKRFAKVESLKDRICITGLKEYVSNGNIYELRKRDDPGTVKRVALDEMTNIGS